MIEYFLPLLITYRYWILIPFSFVEGPIVSFLSGTLVAAGYLNVFVVYVILVLGDVLPDLGYYYLGLWVGESGLQKRFSGMSVHLPAMKRMWDTHTFKATLLSKWAYGIGSPLLMSSGICGVSVKKYAFYSVIITSLQHIVLLSVGYFFGSSLLLVQKSITAIQIIAVSIVVLLIIGYFVASRQARKKVLEETQSPTL
jgi:membrane protein DedA with SNARE-associated domain